MYNRTTSKPPEKNAQMPPATRYATVLAPVGFFLLVFSYRSPELLAWGLGLTFATLALARQEKSLAAALLAVAGLAILCLRACSRYL